MAQLKLNVSLTLFIVGFLCTLASSHTAYQYLMFVTQWPKSVCYSMSVPCSKTPPIVFTVHGLWPSNYTGSTLTCSGAPFDEPLMNQPQQAALKAHLEQHSWPDVLQGNHMGFWRHEWSAHGSCSDNVFAQTEYFKWCDEMWKEKPINEILGRSSIVPGRNKYYSRPDIENAIRANTSHTPDIRCTLVSGTYMLFEVVICVDYYGKNIVDCVVRSKTPAMKTFCPPSNPSILYPN
ncbi:ribonuclease MC-like [Argentina anserina]|uniref:ribonuclease MC-like n=1 Tax=Argentina anserina TaxID=57926 RepID=UPI00217621DD|nr:ribonuclease MC-like [Potentilla anserina]